MATCEDCLHYEVCADLADQFIKTFPAPSADGCKNFKDRSRIGWDIIGRLLRAFPQSFINYNGEVILHRYANEYFILRNCETELDVKCKVLEWCSRAASTAEPYKSKAKNDEFHTFMLKGINQFLETSFTHDDMKLIYTYLGNAIKHDKTVEFITQANYNMGFFRQFEN